MSQGGGPDASDSDAIDVDRSRARTQETYDRIAAHFSETRTHPWPEVVEFVESRPGGDVGLDIGCGNGRHGETLARKVGAVVGLDVSRELLEEARERARSDSWPFHPLQGSAGHIPVAADAVDLAVYVATLHHLPSRAARIRSLDELARVLAPGGQALVSAWSTAHDRFGGDAEAETGFDTTVDWTLPDGETVPRFYHIYAPAEFEADLQASTLNIEASYLSSGNCYAEVRA